MEKIVVANLKMNLEENDIKEYLSVIKDFDNKNIDFYVAPSYIYLNEFLSRNYHLTAQNVSCNIDGAYTGEISSIQLKSIGVDSVIIGHSERRNIFNEDYKIINEKVIHSLNQDLKVILCIGEKNENDLNAMFEELDKDLKNANLDNIIIAYEPEYSIGTGVSASITHIKNVTKKIKEKYNVKVIYGGSVDEENIAEICRITDGVIIGKMSLNAPRLLNMMKKIA